MQSLRETMRGNVRQYGMVIALIAIVVFFQVTTDGILLRPLNLTNLVQQNGYILILGIGMVIVIVARHIDLSVGSVAAFTGALSAVLMTDMGVPWPLAVVLCLACGALIGAWHGFWVAYVGIPAFIVTLSSMLLFRGLTLVVLNGETKGGLPGGFESMGNGFLPEVGPDTGYNNLSLLLGVVVSVVLVVIELRNRATAIRFGVEVSPLAVTALKMAIIVLVIMAFVYQLSQYRGLPIVGVILFALIGIYAFIMRRTVIGRQIYAVGGNVDAATMSGVNTRRIDFLVMTNMGMLASLAGMLTTARLTAANPKAGTNFELDAIAAAFVGGAAVTGGVGTVVGAIIGGLIMGLLNNGMNLESVSINWQQVVKGLVLLMAVAFDVWNKKRSAVRTAAAKPVTVEDVDPDVDPERVKEPAGGSG